MIQGRAERRLEGQTVLLELGDSWVVSRGASHAYKILDAFTTVEATYPPSRVHGRDEPTAPWDTSNHATPQASRARSRTVRADRRARSAATARTSATRAGCATHSARRSRGSAKWRMIASASRVFIAP